MLWFWVIVLVAIIGAIAVVASGAGDSMAEVYDDRPDVSLPVGRPLTAEDLRSVRLNTGVRGYRMDEVDALLARLEAEMLDREASESTRVVALPPEAPHGPVGGSPIETSIQMRGESSGATSQKTQSASGQSREPTSDEA